jgi:aspartate carbamoyltransferase catalytic subunit
MKTDLISMDDLSVSDIEGYLTLAGEMEALPLREKRYMLNGFVMASLFFEPSTRTRLSFESAMMRLGGGVIGFSEVETTSASKGESFADSIRTIALYSDAIVIRHPLEGAARLASRVVDVPVINAGDGANQHPTQTLLDLYTIRKERAGFAGLKIALCGDLKYSRTIHSLIRALMKYDNVHFLLVSPEGLRLPEHFRMHSSSGTRLTFTETTDIEEAIHNCDVLYMTRIQRERFPDPLDYEKVKDAYCLNAEMLKEAPESLRILHPLPRVNEIAHDVDSLPQAGYFPQVLNGLYTRQAILLKLLGVKS